MEENASTGSGNSNSQFVMKLREVEEHEHGMVSKKRKKKDIEEKKPITDNVTRLLYNDTPSDGYDEEKVADNVTSLLYNDTPSDGYDEEKSPSPSPKRIMKPPPFSKVWSDEDEISILRGMIKFKDQTGRDAAQNMAEFRAFILQSLTLQATLVQLREKIRRLREKYEKSLARGNASTTQHEHQLFQLCQKIWTQHPNSSATVVNEKHNIPKQNLLVKEKQNNPEKQHKQNNPEKKHKHNNPEKQQKQNNPEKQQKQNIPHNIQQIQQHRIIPETGLNAQTMMDLFMRVSKDIELVLNSKACLRGNEKEVDMRILELTAESISLRVKLVNLVQEKATSPELRDSPEPREQVVLRAYLEAKIEHAQLLLNAYNSFTKDHDNEAQSSVSAIKD